MGDEHYFNRRPTSPRDRRVLAVALRGLRLRLVTEGGVFSRRRVDPGTRLLIEHMQIGQADRVLDLGCGYGVVGIVAASLASHGSVTAVDVNERAVALTRENARSNAIRNLEALQGDGVAPVAGKAFDVIAFNPPMRVGNIVVHRLIEDAACHLAPGGRFYLVGRTQQGVARLAAKMAQVFGQVEEVAKKGGYRLYLSRGVG